ncbi:hypothetical protein BN946_scf184759.g13 [Trametes cinnabarina]|uniref:Uncharacterized protein n=1 Tax=Pycnoporus cinnabarinus TaxID=5643 RepID=A0A060SB06_PYCCI|nr:hypothetical protein BN946_scf184759.g13 [Trametes cinnabarina]
MKVFGFFSRKPQQPPETVPLPPSPSASTTNLSPSGKADKKNVQLRTPSPSVDSASAALAQPRSTSPATKLARLSVDDSTRNASPTRRGSVTALTAIAPNPVFVPPEPTVDSLTAHIASIPAKVLHSYVLARIPSQPEETLPTLASFFSELAPPPKLHCVRCHKDYTEVENDDRSCLVPHDDESAEVERVGTTKRANRAPGTVGATYETLWGCCGKIVEGDGDQGPPDGWCYEGKHTTDIKRARFRADSTPQDDKLVSCLRLNCHGIRSQLPRGTRTTRKRPRSTNYKEVSTDEDESEGGSDSGMDEIVGKSASARKPRGKGKTKATAPAEEGEQMDVDDDPNAGESASVAGSASAPKRGRPPKSKAKEQAPSSVAKRRVRVTESASKVIPGTDGEDEDAQSVKSAPAGPTPKRRGPGDAVRAEGEGGRAGKWKWEAPNAVVESDAPGEASDANASAKPKSRARKVKEASAVAEGATEGDEKPKKRRKVDA